jgi:hypothetical protein
VVPANIVYLHSIRELFQQLFNATVESCYLSEGREFITRNGKQKGLEKYFV